MNSNRDNKNSNRDNKNSSSSKFLECMGLSNSSSSNSNSIWEEPLVVPLVEEAAVAVEISEGMLLTIQQQPPPRCCKFPQYPSHLLSQYPVNLLWQTCQYNYHNPKTQRIYVLS